MVSHDVVLGSDKVSDYYFSIKLNVEFLNV